MTQGMTEPPKTRFSLLAPVVVFAVIAVALYAGLTLNPKAIPSALIGKLVPEFDLPPLLDDVPGLKTTDLKTGEVVLVNFFASWCAPCRVEHPLLMDIAASGEIPLLGVNHKDPKDNATTWLGRLGNPYRKIGFDRNGRVGIDWGVYGMPETFVVDGEGRIHHKHLSPLTRWDMDNTIMPLVEKLRREAAKSP